MFRTFAVVARAGAGRFQTVAAQPSFSFRVVTKGLNVPWEVISGPDNNSGTPNAGPPGDSVNPRPARSLLRSASMKATIQPRAGTKGSSALPFIPTF